MRRKSIRGRARPSQLPPKPSAMAFSYLGQPSDYEAQHGCPRDDDILVYEADKDGQCSIVPGTSRGSDHDRQCHELAHKTNDETTVFVANKSCGLDTRGIHGLADCSEMDWTEKQVCIKCDKGGKLLICSDTNCPLAVHKECMHCTARFDSLENFYCPYCSYKQAMLETRKARKKAMLAKRSLSVFLDKGIMDGDSQKWKSKRVRIKEPNPSTVVGDIEHDVARNGLDADEANNNSVQIGEDHVEERVEPECPTGILPREDFKASAVNEQNDAPSICGDNGRTDSGSQHKIVIERQMHQGPIIACGGGGGDGACCRVEETGHQFEIVQVRKSVETEHPKLVDNHQHERMAQDEQQARSLSASPEQKETNLDGALHMSTEGELENAEIVKEYEARRPEEEEMQENEQRTTASSGGEESMQQEHAKASDSSHGKSEDASPHLRRTKKKRQNVVQSPSVDHLRRSARKLDGALHMSTKGELDNTETVKEYEARRPEEEEMQENEQRTTASSGGEESMQQEHAKASDSSHGKSKDASWHWRHTKKKKQNVVQSPNVDHPQRSARKLDGPLQMSTEGELDNAEIVKECEARRPEDEEMQENEQRTTASSSGEESMRQEHAKASDSSHEKSEDVSPHWRRIKKKRQKVVQSPNVDHPRRSARNLSFEPNTTVHKEKKNATRKSRQQLLNPSFPNTRRKKLPWTTDEEEMLKEGVQKFSTTINKNLPWRKILEFGSHVFDGTRTPVDLKDKWRNMLAKGCSPK